MALFALSPFLAPAEIEVWLALSKVFKFAYCDRVNPESMGYYETIVQNVVATTVVHVNTLSLDGSATLSWRNICAARQANSSTWYIMKACGFFRVGVYCVECPDLGNTTSLYDLKDFTLLLPPGITYSNIGHFAKAIVGADGKVINLCDHVVYTVEKRY
ncbi:hypothetical protein EMCRGX_G009192 [Ephydatia muelleri]